MMSLVPTVVVAVMLAIVAVELRREEVQLKDWSVLIVRLRMPLGRWTVRSARCLYKARSYQRCRDLYRPAK